MKNRILLFLVAALMVAVSSASQAASTQSAAQPAAKAQTHAQPASKVAPLDEYFGKMKLSPLGINNTIHDTSLHVKYDAANAGKYYQSLEWAENALHDWASKYPQDTWLPGRAYFMSHVFWQMHTAEADAAADRCRQMLFTQFPKSRWTAMAKHETKDAVAPVVSQAASVPAQGGGAAAQAAKAPHR